MSHFSHLKDLESDTKISDSNLDDCIAFLCEVFENLDVDTITLYLLKSRNVVDALDRIKSFISTKESQPKWAQARKFTRAFSRL